MFKHIAAFFKISLDFTFLFILYSCGGERSENAIVFSDPLPFGEKNLSQFPSDFTGFYRSDPFDESSLENFQEIEITKNCIRYKNYSYIAIHKSELDSTYKHWKLKGNYILDTESGKKMPVKIEGDSLYVLDSYTSEECLSSDKILRRLGTDLFVSEEYYDESVDTTSLLEVPAPVEAPLQSADTTEITSATPEGPANVKSSPAVDSPALATRPDEAAPGSKDEQAKRWLVKKISLVSGKLTIGEVSISDMPILNELTGSQNDSTFPRVFSPSNKQLKDFIGKGGFSDAKVYSRLKRKP